MRVAAEVVLVLVIAAPAWAQPERPDAMALARHAYELARAGELETAVAELREAIRIAPGNPLYRSALGGIYKRLGKIEEAVAAADRGGISGQAVTPFVLAYLHEHSGGETRRVNRDLIVDNAGLAGAIATAYATL